MSVTSALGDGFVVAKRNLIKIKRVPDLLVFTTLQPIMFVLLFVYVFGGAIAVKGSRYNEFLIAGIFAQTVIFGSVITGAGLADDIQKGIIDRFRSLPMSPSAVLLTFVANTFVPIFTLPGPLRTFAEWNPVSSVTQAARELFGNIPPNTPASGGALQHPVTYTLMWSAAILVVFVPLTTRQFRRSVSR
jgi:ABC-type multidrug transport system permease subunit